MSKPVKILLWIAGILAILLVLFQFVLWPIMKTQTKKHSPETEAHITVDGTTVDIYYNSPSKKGREIFGELVPYDEVWRTGANEPTRFVTSGDLAIGDGVLPAGEYTLWTKPGKELWEIYFNSEMYEWGVTLTGGKAARVAEYDVVAIRVPAVNVDFVTENFTIELSEVDGDIVMALRWDKTAVPLTMGVN